jgi:hypothetical protein
MHQEDNWVVMKAHHMGMDTPFPTTSPLLESRDAPDRGRDTGYRDDFAEIAKSVHGAALGVSGTDAGRILVTIRGLAVAMDLAFGTRLYLYQSIDGAFLPWPQGTLTLPAPVVAQVAAVLGLESTPIAVSLDDNAG